MRRNKYRPTRERGFDVRGNRGKSLLPLEIDWAQLVRIRKLSVINYSAICDAKSNFDALFGFYLSKVYICACFPLLDNLILPGWNHFAAAWDLFWWNVKNDCTGLSAPTTFVRKLSHLKFSTPSCCQRVLKSIEEHTIIKFDVFQRSVYIHIKFEKPQNVIYILWRGSNHNMKN